MSNTNSDINRHLGQKSAYISQYDPSLLVRESRQRNRENLNISDDNLPFIGNDTWDGYEISALTEKGLPVTGIAKIVYSCTNKYIVESKSIKLYFNSFNMTQMGINAEDVRYNMQQAAIKDLSTLLETEVKVCIFPTTERFDHQQAWSPLKTFNTLEDIVDVTNLVINEYKENPQLLEIVKADSKKQFKYHSSLLKSNCKITFQPDWGDVYIKISGNNTVTPSSLLKYIISFRDENHFHEQITESIYKRLWDLLNPTELSVMCLYVRRGGWHICPERASHKYLLHPLLSDVNVLSTKTSRQ